MIEKWQALLAQLEVEISNERQEIWNKKELQVFQTKTGIIFPDSYQEFCQVFGTGMFGDYMRIYCPNINMSNLFLGSIKNEINKFPAPLHGNILDVASLKKLLDSAFVFGDNASADIVFWDLRTYSSSDKSYDIYITNSDCFDGKIYKIGRDFYEFVRDFCLGMKSYEVLPEVMRPAPQALTLIFYPFDSRSQFTEDVSMQEQQIWHKNVDSGVVLRMAQTYEDRGQLTEALLLHIKHLKEVSASGEEGNRLFRGIKRLQEVLGESLFRVICQAAGYSPEELLLSMTLWNVNSTSNANAKQQLERFEVEHLPNPDAEFQQVWQNFLQSVRERLKTEIASSINDSNTEFREIQQEIRQILPDFIQATQNSQSSNATSSSTSSSLNFQQAWQTLQQSICCLEEKYPPRQLVFDENFKHLHLPLRTSITRSDWSHEMEEIELVEQQQAVRQRNPYAFFRYLKTFKGHSAPVYQVRFSPDATLLASGSADRTIKLWDLNSHQEIYTLTGHTNAVISLAMSPDGKLLASGSADRTIKLWNLSTGQIIHTLTGHTSSVLSLAISPDNQTLVSGSADRTIKLWNLSTGQIIHTLTGHNHSVLCVAISPNCQTLASGSADSTLKLWDLSTGQETSILDRETYFVFAISFHPDGQRLASVDGNKTIKLWNFCTREVIRTIPTTETVVSLAISPDGQTLAGSCGSSPIKVIGMWDLKTGKLISSFCGDNDSVNHYGIVYDVAFSPDGKILVSGGKDTTVKLWGTPPPLNIE